MAVVWVMGAWDGTGRDGMPSPTLSAREWAGGSGGGCTAAQYWRVDAKRAPRPIGDGWVQDGRVRYVRREYERGVRSRRGGVGIPGIAS